MAGTNGHRGRRILMIAPQPFFRPRGTPFSVLHRIRALLRLGHTVDLVTYPFGETPRLPGLTVHRARRPPGVRDVGVGPSVAKLLLDGPLFMMAGRLAQQGRFDLLHTHEEAGVVGARLAPALGIPHLYDMHSSLPQQFANFGRFNWWPVVGAFRAMERYILASADGVIAICTALGEHVLTAGYSGPLEVIENTMDFDPPVLTDQELRELRERHGVGNDPLVVYTGTLEQYQGLHLLVAAAAEVRRSLPGVRYLVVGGAPAQSAALQRMVAAEGLADSFRCIPAVSPEDVPRYQAMADVLVTTRMRGTNTPLKLYQYLRAGRPIVATDVPSHTQVLSPECAQLVPPAPPAIADGLLRVLSDRPYAGALAERARQLAQDRYSDAVYLERLQRLLNHIGSGRTRRGENGGGVGDRGGNAQSRGSSVFRQSWCATDYDADRFGGSFGRYLEMDEVSRVARLAEGGGGRVLDAGAGTGKVTLGLRARRQEVVSSDFSRPMLRIARAKADTLGLGGGYVATDILALSFADRSFHATVCSRVLMHLDDWCAGIRELCRVTRESLIVDFPAHASFAGVDALWKRATWRGPRGARQPYRTFRFGAVRRELARHGFTVTRVERSFFFPMRLHRQLNRPALSGVVEAIAAALGLVALFGSPVTVKAVRSTP